jgi:hypothetical protein
VVHRLLTGPRCIPAAGPRAALVADRTVIELVPGELWASIHRHRLGPPRLADARTAITSGLRKVGQREVVLTLVHDRHAMPDFPDSLLWYFTVLRDLAIDGRPVGPGGISGYAAPGPFGLGSFVGAGFAEPQPVADVPVPEDALAAVLLTEAELAMAMKSSLHRVLSRLGQAARFFPWPFWSDPARRSVYAAEDADRTLLALLPRVAVGGASATLSSSDIILSIPTEAAGAVAQQLHRREAICILPSRDPEVAAALVWRPGQQEPAAIHAEPADGSRIAAAFVALVPSDEPGDRIRFQEDGFSVLLASETVRGVVRGLLARQEVVVNDPTWTLTIRPAEAR